MKTNAAAELSASRPSSARAAPADEYIRAAVTALYRDHALALIRLAHVMLGSKTAGEDVVQEAFCGLYRRWPYLSDPDKALPYPRASVLNGCRSVQRRAGRDSLARWTSRGPEEPPEEPMAASDERRLVVDGLRRLPYRQREALVLRFYLDMSDAEIARDMGISQGTVRSTTHRALAALGVVLKESS